MVQIAVVQTFSPFRANHLNILLLIYTDFNIEVTHVRVYCTFIKFVTPRLSNQSSHQQKGYYQHHIYWCKFCLDFWDLLNPFNYENPY